MAAPERVAVEGPVSWVQAWLEIEPPGSEAEPVSVAVEAGRMMVWSLPALTIGLLLGAAATVTVVSSVAVRPLLSVTVRRKI